MGHDADSRVLEEYYMDYSPESAVSAALLNESVEEETARMVATNAPLAIYKYFYKMIKSIYNNAIIIITKAKLTLDPLDL